MKKMISLVGLVALGAIGCGSNPDVMNNTAPDMAMMQQQQNPDLAPTCVTGTPATNEDFLNACTTAASVDIVPFYPDKAPNGVLPPLQ
jgi:hypothetical protein